MKFIQTTILIAACLVASVGATTAFAETGAPSSQATASAKVGLFVRLDAKQGAFKQTELKFHRNDKSAVF